MFDICFRARVYLSGGFWVLFHNNRQEKEKKNMKRQLGFLGVALLFCVVQMAWAEETVNLSGNFRFKSQHISAGGFAYGEPALVSAAGVEWRKLRFEVIHFAKTPSHESDQLNLGLAYSWKSGMPGFDKSLDWEVGLALEDARDFFKNDRQEDFFNYFVKTALPFEFQGGKLIIAPFVKAEFYTPVNMGEGGHGGSYIWLGVDSTQNFEWCSLVQRLALLIDSGVYSADSGELLRYLGQLSWPLAKWLTFNFPIFEASVTLSEFTKYDRHDEFSYGGSFAFNHDLLGK